MFNNVKPVSVNISQDGLYEFFETNGAGSVLVKYSEYLISLRARAAYSVVIKGFPEFSEVKFPAGIIVHNFELSLQADEALDTALCESMSEPANDEFVLLLVSKCTKGLLGLL